MNEKCSVGVILMSATTVRLTSPSRVTSGPLGAKGKTMEFEDAADRAEWQARMDVKMDYNGYWSGCCDRFLATFEQGDNLPLEKLKPPGEPEGEYMVLPPCQCGRKLIFPGDIF